MDTLADKLSISIILISLGAALGLLALYFRNSLINIFLFSIGILLSGYLLCGKGFAYLGYSPFFIGEGILLIGVTLLATHRFPPELLRKPLTWLILANLIWGALRTIPYVPAYGLDAIRDSALWYYGLFALATSTAIYYAPDSSTAINYYRRIHPWIIACLPVFFALTIYINDAIPSLPRSPVPVIFLKPGDVAVHLGTALVFAVLASRFSEKFAPQWSVWRWLLWTLGAFFAVSLNRGGLIVILFACAFLALARVSAATAIRRGAVLLVILSFIGLLSTQIDRIPSPRARAFSIEQISRNIESIFTEDRHQGLSDTKRWRKDWWTKIVNYTFSGPFFWGGKGCGVNLASDDGFQVTADESLRSPHNVHMTVLARSGVPGFAIWVCMNLFAITGAVLSFLRDPQRYWPEACGAYFLTAALMNGAFDVYLEGPQGGIWYWCVLGFILARSVKPHPETAKFSDRPAL